MARPPSVWFREEDGYYYTTRNRKQIKLSQDKAEATRAFHALMAAGVAPDNRRPTVARLADEFLEQSKAENEPGTYETHRRFLQSFCDHAKGRKAPDIRPEHMAAWLKANPGWGQSTRTLATQIVKAAFNLAVLNGKIDGNPIAKAKQAGFSHRDRILTADEREKIRNRATGNFRDFWMALEQTGARPYSEIGRMTADMIDWEEGSVTLPKHKTSKKGKKRTVYLTPDMVVLLRRLAEKRPTGRLFLTNRGTPWSSYNCCYWLKRFDQELGIKGIVIYSARHTFICDALERGVPLAMVAELVGNSVKVLLKYYVHLSEKKDALRAAALKAIG